MFPVVRATLDYSTIAQQCVLFGMHDHDLGTQPANRSSLEQNARRVLDTMRQHGIDKGTRPAVNGSESDALRIIRKRIPKDTGDWLF